MSEFARYTTETVPGASVEDLHKLFPGLDEEVEAMAKQPDTGEGDHVDFVMPESAAALLEPPQSEELLPVHTESNPTEQIIPPITETPVTETAEAAPQPLLAPVEVEVATGAQFDAVNASPEASVATTTLESTPETIAPSVPTEQVADDRPEQSEPLRYVTVDTSALARDAAVDHGDERLSESIESGNFVQRFAKRIWKGNLLKEHYRRKEIARSLDTITDTQDVLVHQTDDNKAKARAVIAITDRFLSEQDEMLREGKGEKKEALTDDSEFSKSIKGLIERFATGELTEEALIEERTRLFNNEAERGKDKDLLGEGLVRSDNLIEIANAVMGAVEHGDSLQNVLDNLQIVTGVAKSEISGAHYTKVDKILEKLGQKGINSEFVSTAVTVGASLLRFGSHSAVGAATRVIAPGIGSGIFAGFRENFRTKLDRAQHDRDTAMGITEFTGSAKRRAEINETVYEKHSAVDMATGLREATSEEVLDGSKEALDVAIEALARVSSRINLADQKDINLVSYTSPEDVSAERFNLDLARAEARVAIEKQLTPEMKQQLGLEPDQSLREFMNAKAELEVEDMHEDISSKDKAFNKLRARRIAKSVAIGTATGLVFGTIAQEGIAAIDPTRAGLLEQLWHAKTVEHDGEIHQTVLEGLVNGDKTTEHVGPSADYSQHSFAENSKFSISNDSTVEQNPNGTLDIIDHNGHHTIDNLAIGKDGKLPASSISELHKAGLHVNQTVFETTKTVTSTETQTKSVADYVTQHSSETTAVKRDLWYNENTPAFDKNELGLHWAPSGGADESGFHLSTATMSENGSYADGQSVGWQQAAESGDLKLAVSASDGTQDKVFMVNINGDGSINIPKDSPAAHFFGTENGQPTFKGAYAEVVQTTGTDSAGVEHIRPLATLVGDHSVTSVTEQVQTTTTVKVPHFEYKITSNGYSIEHQNFTEQAPFIPVEARKPLEARRREQILPGGEIIPGSGYNMQDREAMFERWRKERSPRLRANPDADLNTGAELSWYRTAQDKLRGGEYTAEIDAYINNDPVLRTIGQETKAFVAIPVAAANESETVYKTLSMFAQQDKESRDSSVIIMNVNWKQSLESNPDTAAKIEKTKNEILRAKADFPDLRIASFEKVWSDEFVRERDGKIYGEVIKPLYDAAAYAIERAVRENRRSSNAESLLITNDADTQGISRTYLRNYIRSMEQNGKDDVFSGVIRRGTESYKEFPGYGVASDFYAMLGLVMARRQRSGGGGVTSDGPNTGIRMSMYAASGGVEASIGAGADAAIGWRITQARQNEGERTTWDRLRNKKPVPASPRTIGRVVSGVQLDTMPDRLLGAYRQGRWIADGWNGFDNGGYEDRSVSMGAGTLEREDPETDIDGIADRIEVSVRGFASNWFQDPATISSALALTFGPNSSSEQLYDYNWKYSDDGTPKSMDFKFTDAGKKKLQDRLLRNSRGEADSFGNRLSRQLYNRVSGPDARQPVTDTPRYVS